MYTWEVADVGKPFPGDNLSDGMLVIPLHPSQKPIHSLDVEEVVETTLPS